MDPSAVCRLHPGVAVTGFCPACLRDRLAGLQPPSSADLRRCKSFSFTRSASAVEPQRRSCDLFRHHQVPEEQAADYQYQYQEEEPQAAEQGALYSSSRKSFLGRKLQQWRRKSKKEPEMPGAQAQRHRPSCDVPVLARLPATMLSQLPVEEDDDDDMTMAPAPVPRSDGQIPVEEDYYCYFDDASAAAANPGGTAQTRDYYLDSSSSSRRRRSVDRSATSGRNSFSDANNGGELPASWAANGNARVSPAVAADQRPLYHHHYHHEAQSVLVHHQYDFSAAGSHRQSSQATKQPNSGKKQGIRGWSIWGLLHKKSSRKQQLRPAEAAPAGADDGYPAYPWPELRARGYDGQMLRCNSSISARSSFSGGAAMIGGSGRRSISGVDMRGGDGLLSEKRRTRRADEVLLERTRSSSYSRSSGHGLLDPATAMGVHHHQQQSSRPPNIPRRSSSKHELSSMHSRSTLGL